MVPISALPRWGRARRGSRWTCCSTSTGGFSGRRLSRQLMRCSSITIISFLSAQFGEAALPRPLMANGSDYSKARCFPLSILATSAITSAPFSVYTHLSDQYSVFGTRVISCSPREALYVLDGLLENNTILRLREHYTDTHGLPNTSSRCLICWA